MSSALARAPPRSFYKVHYVAVESSVADVTVPLPDAVENVVGITLYEWDLPAALVPTVSEGRNTFQFVCVRDFGSLDRYTATVPPGAYDRDQLLVAFRDAIAAALPPVLPPIYTISARFDPFYIPVITARCNGNSLVFAMLFSGAPGELVSALGFAPGVDAFTIAYPGGLVPGLGPGAIDAPLYGVTPAGSFSLRYIDVLVDECSVKPVARVFLDDPNYGTNQRNNENAKNAVIDTDNPPRRMSSISVHLRLKGGAALALAPYSLTFAILHTVLVQEGVPAYISRTNMGY
jgi:hypothetical protein